MKFSDIPGHDDLKQRLIAMVAGGRLPHALLFEGPAGSAKMMLARAFVQYIHCTGRGAGDSESCGRCPSCIQHTGFNHPDTFYSFPVIKKGDAPVSDMFMKEWKIMLSENPLMDFQQWTALLDNVNAQPRIYVSEGHEIIRRLNVTAVASEYKVVLMWLPEKMQTECANKILKIVEEPFTDSMFVMVSDSPRAILPTIYSRLQRINVSRYSDSEVARFLVESEGVADAVAGDIASISEGNLIRAKHLLATKDTSNAWLDMFAALM
ncbi:MAG: DNA polymerase III subunit delta, partial [Muribaculaceae bacterium]|nr:DNA polymerase III subunit delta [Muribaculaceae bacterium]